MDPSGTGESARRPPLYLHAATGHPAGYATTGARRAARRGAAVAANQGAAWSTRIRKTDDEWRALLTPEQYKVARKKGTERAFSGEYWDNHAPGTYRCVCCGTPLFDADDQVRLRHRLAELLAAAGGGRVREESDDQLVHAPHRGRLRRLRRAPRPRVRRRPGADRACAIASTPPRSSSSPKTDPPRDAPAAGRRRPDDRRGGPPRPRAGRLRRRLGARRARRGARARREGARTAAARPRPAAQGRARRAGRDAPRRRPRGRCWC